MTLKSRIQKFSLSGTDLKKPETTIETTPVEVKEPVKQYESLHFDLLTDQEILYKDIIYEKTQKNALNNKKKMRFRKILVLF